MPLDPRGPDSVVGGAGPYASRLSEPRFDIVGILLLFDLLVDGYRGLEGGIDKTGKSP